MNHKSILREPFFWWAGLLALTIGAGLTAAFFVFTRGLVVTNLTDHVPWGLWIGIDLSSIALAAGAFTISAAVYILRKKHLQPIAKTAVFIGFIGYSMAVLSLLLDIGQPLRFWHGLVFWNIHSPLWEVTMCVTLYFTVLTLEVMPIFGKAEWLRARRPRLADQLTRIHRLAPYLAVAGLCFSLLHQSSLGAAYGVLAGRPFWYRPWLAVLFFVSAVVAGPALAVLASKLAARFTPRANVDHALLDRVSRFVGWALLFYFILRVADLTYMSLSTVPGRAATVDLLLTGPTAWHFWGGEFLFGMIVPLFILLNPHWRRNPSLHLLALALVVGGLIAYRWNTNMVGQLVLFSDLTQPWRPLYTSYTPSLVEIAAGAGVVAYGLLAFTLGVRYLKVVDHGVEPEAIHDTAERRPAPAMAGD